MKQAVRECQWHMEEKYKSQKKWEGGLQVKRDDQGGQNPHAD